MTENNERMLAVDGVNLRVEQQINSIDTFFTHATQDIKNEFAKIYARAVWVDLQLSGSCVVDPFFMFHFFEDEDAVAYKLKWS